MSLHPLPHIHRGQVGLDEGEAVGGIDALLYVLVHDAGVLAGIELEDAADIAGYGVYVLVDDDDAGCMAVAQDVADEKFLLVSLLTAVVRTDGAWSYFVALCGRTMSEYEDVRHQTVWTYGVG